MPDGRGYQARLTTPSAWAAYAHLRHHFGDPVAIWELPDPQTFRAKKLDVAQFSPMGDGSTALLATCGVSNVAMPNGKFAELFLLTRPAPDEETAVEAARLLRRVSLTSVTHNVPMQAGLMLRMPAEGRAFGRFSACLLFPPLAMVQTFATIEHKDGKRVAWWWVVPVFEQEAVFAEEYGAQELYARLAEEQADLADLRRDPLESMTQQRETRILDLE